MATTVVYPSIDVSGTGSISTHIGTNMTLAGSLTCSTLAVTGTSTFSGTAVFLTTAQFLGTTTFSGTAVFLTAAVISGTLSVGTLVVSGTASFSATVAFANATVTTLGVTGSASFAAQATFAATVTMSATAVFTTTPLVNRGTGLYAPNSFLLATASGATSTQFKLTFSNTTGAFTYFTLMASGKGNALTTNFIIYLYTDGGTTPFVTYATVAAATATASEGVLLMDITHDIATSGLCVAVPRFQHFVGVTTQNTQTRTATFTVSAINCIGVSLGSTTTTRTMSAASIYLTGYIGNK